MLRFLLTLLMGAIIGAAIAAPIAYGEGYDSGDSAPVCMALSEDSPPNIGCDYIGSDHTRSGLGEWRRK